jgi:endonuclease/exonuclease/phosphatase (EEP) superfamily protein YafD
MVLSIPLVAKISDISLEGLNKNHANPDYKIVQFNTEFWEPRENIPSLLRTISEQKADIYHFQEFIPDVERNQLTPDTIKETLETLQKELPEYSIIHSAELITATRFPVFAYYEHPEDYYLRTDVWIDDTIVRVYNVHLPVHIDPSYKLRNIDVLFDDLKSRFDLRQSALEAIYSDIESSERPFMITGDFNSSSSMRTLSYLNKITKDSAYTNTILPSATWGTKTLRAWRIDYILGSDAINFASHSSNYLPEFSDHSMLIAEFSLETVEDNASRD